MNRLVLAFSIFYGAVSAYAGTISDVTIGQKHQGQDTLTFQGAGTLPKSALVSASKWLILDFPDTKTSFGNRSFSLDRVSVKKLDIVNGDSKTRAVITLSHANQPFEITKKGNDVVVTFVADENNSASNNNITVTKTPVKPKLLHVNAEKQVAIVPNQFAHVSNQLLPSIKSVPSTPIPSATLKPVYKKINQNKSILSFLYPSDVEKVDVKQNGQNLIVNLQGMKISRSEQKRMDFSAYKGMLDYVDIYRTPSGVRLLLNIKDINFKYNAYLDDGTYYIELIKPNQNINQVMKQVEEIQGFGSAKRYKGKPISLNFQDIEVRAVLQIIAEFTGINIVVSDSVSGNITLKLDRVPWDQALDIILKTKGLGKRESGNVIYIAPAESLNRDELDALKTIQEKNDLVPSRTELFHIKYADASSLAALIEQSRKGGGNNANTFFKDSILSSKGTVTVDGRTNTLLISDIPTKLDAVRDLITKLDKPVRQVLIDARLVLTTDTFAKDLGSKLGLTFAKVSGRNLFSGSGDAKGASDYATEVNNDIVKQARSLRNTGKLDDSSEVKLPSLSDRLGVKFGLAQAAPSYGLAILGADFLVDLELSALQTEGKAEIVSSPRVVTQNGQKARIASGQQIPYLSAGQNGATKVEFKNAELSLDVTPRIAPDDRVNMQLDVKKDSPNAGLQSGGNIGINTNQLQTNVLVDNGATLVLGGIFEQNQSFSKDKVPLLGDLPVVGNLFNKTSNKNVKSELVIFVTPRIIGSRLSDDDKFSNLRE